MVDPTSIIGLGGISGELPHRKGNDSSRRQAKNNGLERKLGLTDDEIPANMVEDPNAKLIEALDRLRATNELGSAESELVATVRGVKYYQEESRTGLPILRDDLAKDGLGREDDQDLPPSTQHLA